MSRVVVKTNNKSKNIEIKENTTPEEVVIEIMKLVKDHEYGYLLDWFYTFGENEVLEFKKEKFQSIQDVVKELVGCTFVTAYIDLDVVGYVLYLEWTDEGNRAWCAYEGGTYDDKLFDTLEAAEEYARNNLYRIRDFEAFSIYKRYEDEEEEYIRMIKRNEIDK